jgi:hypothetical protein
MKAAEYSRLVGNPQVIPQRLGTQASDLPKPSLFPGLFGERKKQSTPPIPPQILTAASHHVIFSRARMANEGMSGASVALDPDSEICPEFRG